MGQASGRWSRWRVVCRVYMSDATEGPMSLISLLVRAIVTAICLWVCSSMPSRKAAAAAARAASPMQRAAVVAPSPR